MYENCCLSSADNRDAAYAVSSAVIDNLQKSADVQNLLFKLADNRDAAKEVASAVNDNFEMMPENVRNELQKILEKYGYSIFYKKNRKYKRTLE